jgi:hypothetical protein
MSSAENERKRVSRRQFVRQAATGTAAAVGAGLLASCSQTPQVVKETVEVPVEVIKEVTVAAPAAAPRWELVNPEGVVVVEPVEVNPHPSSLEGKTVALYWNGKHNGNNFLDRVAELLTEQVKGIQLVKIYDKHPETATISGSPEKSQAKAQTIAQYKPDLVISSQCD